MKIQYLKQGSSEWLEWRRRGIGSADIAAIMGKSPWLSPQDVYEQKTGLVPPAEPNPAMTRGTYYEQEAREAFHRLIQGSFFPICCVHGEVDFCIASLDGFDFATKTVLEIKVPGKKTMDLAGEGKVAEHYLIQMQWQMFVSGADLAYFFCYVPEGKETRLIKVPRDPVLMIKLQEEATHFWNNFKKGIPPTTKKDKRLIQDESFEAAVTEYKRANTKLKAYQQLVELHRSKILTYATKGSFGGYGVTVLESKPRVSYDVERMKKDGIPIEKYVKIGNSEESYRITID